MEKIFVTADSTCDLSNDLLEKYNISLIPLYINKDGKSYRDRIDIHPEEIFDYYKVHNKLTTTSAPSVKDYLNLFKPLIEQGAKVIHISISSGFSISYQNACIAKDELNDDNIYVVNSRNLSTGSGLVVLKCCEMIEQEKDAKYIYSHLVNDFVNRVESSFVVDNLTYLHKGGRCSSVAKLGSNLLKLKPCIEVVDGKMDVGKKYRGDFSKCILQYIDDRLANRDDLDDQTIFITYTPIPEKLLEQVYKKVKSLNLFKSIYVTQAGCTISNHCGPNTLGILFVRSK